MAAVQAAFFVVWDILTIVKDSFAKGDTSKKYFYFLAHPLVKYTMYISTGS